jgi:flagellar hook-length control protein FliK
MNAHAMNLNPSQAVQPQNPAGKQADSTAAETPFSQVLSSEIAQNRKGDEARQDAEAGQDTAAQAGGSIEGGTIPATTTPEAGAPALDLHSADQVIDAIQATNAIQVTDAAPAPEALLGLVPPPAQLKPEAVGMASAATEASATLPASMQPAALPSLQNLSKGSAALATQTGPLANNGRGNPKIDPALPGKAAVQAAQETSAFPTQLAAARQADVQMAGELLSDLMSHPAMRPATHAPHDALPAPGEIASPRLAPSVGTTAWGQALGEKIVWMASNTQQTATLTLNPPNLGPLQVVLNVSNEQATASFFAAQPEVRQALEAAFPRLREMMNEAGIQLGQATVSADTPQQFNDSSDRQAQRAGQAFPGADEAIAAGMQPVQAPVQRSGRGLVDTFA